MRKRLILVALVFIALATACLSSSPEEVGQAAENRILREELSLARTSAPYFMFDLGKKKIALKAKGMVLKTWDIRALRFWGGPPPLSPLAVVKKTSLFAPERKTIQPGEAEDEDSFDIEALELKDMPVSFSLIVEGGIAIYVRPRAEGFGRRLASIGPFLRWYGRLPLTNLWRSLKGKKFTQIDIRLSGSREAQALYWALTEGRKGLLFFANYP